MFTSPLPTLSTRSGWGVQFGAATSHFGPLMRKYSVAPKVAVGR